MSNKSMIKNSTSYPKILYDELEKLNKENNDNIKMNLFDYQKYIYDYMTKMDNRGILLYHSVGSGKCMKIDTPILMYDGNIKKIQYIKVDDLLMGDDNTPRKVLSLARGVDNMYDILHNNEKYTVNEAHILCLKIPSYPLIRSNKKYKSVHWIENNKFCIKKFYNKNNTIDDIDIFLKNIINEQILEISVYDYLKLSNRKKKILYSYKTIIDFPEKQLNIDPYTLGIWIGDINTDIFNYNIKTHFIDELKKLNLPNNKHIPYIYKCNSRKNRLELLAGIIDVAGYYNKKNKYVIKLGKNYPILLDHILYLCNSLGYISYKKNIKNTNYIYISGNKLTDIPTQEFNNVQIINSKKDTTFGHKIKVIYKNIDNYFGFTIDGNCRYVLGNFIVTHNTITSISIAEHFRQLDKDIIILSSKSLQNNYKKEITSFSKKINPEVNDDEIESIISQYKFVTSNAKNMIKSLETDDTLNLSKSKKRSDNNIENILSDINTQNLEDKIVIIDEAHNLFNSISNGSKIANDFYDMIMNTKNVKLIFLSGTPIINDPFEIAICCNMLYGPIYSENIKKNKKKEYSTILPEYYTDFKKYFINEENANLSIKNTGKFMNRIFGLISYYGDFYFENQGNIHDELKKTLKKENYPDRLPVIFEIVEMSKYQNIEYTKARNIEKKENSSFRGSGIEKIGSSIVREKGNVSTSYRIKSRQLSNIYIPDKTDIIKQNLRIYSPKLERIYKNIDEKHKNSISLVYSTFLEYGIKAFAKVLEFNNYKLYDKNSDNKESNSDIKYYAIFSGDQSPEEKADILNTLNLEENKYGKLISVLLISKSGTEGLDLKNVRSIHIMEPYWNFSLIQQIIARGVRYKSHIILPEEEQNVQTYIYLSDYNKEMLENEKSKIKERKKSSKKNKKEDKIELTTDINIFKNAIKNQELIYIFLKTIASTSIECPFFNKNKLNYDCFNCISDNKDLYYEDIDKDMELSNNCKRITTIKAEEIIINGETYYYRKLKDNIEVFKYNDTLKGYTKINNPDIVDKIQNL